MLQPVGCPLSPRVWWCYGRLGEASLPGKWNFLHAFPELGTRSSFSKLLLHPDRVYRQITSLMEPTINTPTAPVAANRPVMAHTTLQPLPKHSVLIAVLIAAVLPALLLALAITVMLSAKYNFLDWME